MKRLFTSVDNYFNGPGASQRGDKLYKIITKTLTGVLISVIIVIAISGLQLIAHGLGNATVYYNSLKA